MRKKAKAEAAFGVLAENTVLILHRPNMNKAWKAYCMGTIAAETHGGMLMIEYQRWPWWPFKSYIWVQRDNDYWKVDKLK